MNYLPIRRRLGEFQPSTNDSVTWLLQPFYFGIVYVCLYLPRRPRSKFVGCFVAKEVVNYTKLGVVRLTTASDKSPTWLNVGFSSASLTSVGPLTEVLGFGSGTPDIVSLFFPANQQLHLLQPREVLFVQYIHPYHSVRPYCQPSLLFTVRNLENCIPQIAQDEKQSKQTKNGADGIRIHPSHRPTVRVWSRPEIVGHCREVRRRRMYTGRRRLSGSDRPRRGKMAGTS